MAAELSEFIRHVSARLAPDGRTDGELLAQFTGDRDEDAFATLIRRHGPMVLGTCRRVLGPSGDVDDAFQAAFLVLLGKARALADRGCVGNWLYGVAYHSALKARDKAVKRQSKEAKAPPRQARDEPTELTTVLDEELARLPEKYRAVAVLCELEGLSRRDVAQRLGIPQGTVSSRLTTAHRMLERRLRDRGFAAVGSLALAAGTAAVVPDVLAKSTLIAALGAPSGAAVHLAAEVKKMMFMAKLKSGVVVGTTVAMAAIVGWQQATVSAQPAVPAPTVPIVADGPTPKEAVPREPAWKNEFRKAYGLNDGDWVRRVEPPYPDCREAYLNDVYKLDRQKGGIPASHWFLVLAWRGNWSDLNLGQASMPIKPEDGVSLERIFAMTLGVNVCRTRIDSAVPDVKVTGDFVVRASTAKTDAEREKERDQIAKQLQAILRGQCKVPVRVFFKEVDEQVFVLAGKYAPKPLPGRPENEVDIFAERLTDPGGGGGRGSLEECAHAVEGFVSAPVAIGKVEGGPRRIHWHFNVRSPATPQEFTADRDPAKVLDNLAQQTGLTLTQEKRTIRVLRVEKIDDKEREFDRAKLPRVIKVKAGESIVVNLSAKPAEVRGRHQRSDNKAVTVTLDDTKGTVRIVISSTQKGTAKVSWVVTDSTGGRESVENQEVEFE